MPDIEVPSFSLGLDFDIDSEPQIFDDENLNIKQAPNPHIDSSAPNDDKEFGPRVSDSDFETGPSPPRVLKRLRRGGLTRLHETPISSRCDGNDDIEEFSSDENAPKESIPSIQHHSMCSSSKVPLHGCGIVMTQSTSQRRGRQKNPILDSSASASVGTSQSKMMFPQLTVSPLRRFQLIDSDSDDSLGIKDVSNNALKVDPFSRKQQYDSGHSVISSDQMREASDNKPKNVDLWKDFSPVTSSHIPTPAFDEMCEEYFRSVKNKNVEKEVKKDAGKEGSWSFGEFTNDQNIETPLNVDGPLPPAHSYFFHDDPRIQKLVRNRFLYYFPLGVDGRGSQQHDVSAIDYMGQFGNGEPSKRKATRPIHNKKLSKRGRNISTVDDTVHASWMNTKAVEATQKSNVRKNSRKGKGTSEKLDASGSWVDPKRGKTAKTNSAKKSSEKARGGSKKLNSGEAFQTSGSWVDPRGNGSVRKDINRQVQGNGQSTGHWYTGSDGRRVFVNKNGQELTGQIAYRHYKKESGGFKKGKKRTNSNKKKG